MESPPPGSWQAQYGGAEAGSGLAVTGEGGAGLRWVGAEAGSQGRAAKVSELQEEGRGSNPGGGSAATCSLC